MLIVTRKSDMTGRTNTMALPISRTEYDTCMQRWLNGVLIQEAFPMLDADQREFIKTGMSPAEWDQLFQEDK